RQQLSASAAAQLLERGDHGVDARVDAAWHLLNAGEEERGADLMTAAAREFLQHQGVEDVEQVVRAIETALELYEKQGRSKYEIARLLFPLMSLAFFIDWRVTLKHGERAIDLGLDITGLGLAGRLSRFLPDKLALGEAHWKAMYGGILFSLGIVYPYEFGQRALEMAKEMDTLGVRVWSMAAEEVRMLHHAFRGETEEVQRFRERVELFAVQGS